MNDKKRSKQIAKYMRFFTAGVMAFVVVIGLSFSAQAAQPLDWELDIRGIIGGIAGTAGSFVTEKAPGMQQLSSIGKLAGNVGGASKGKPKIVFLLILLAVLWIADVLLQSLGLMPAAGSYFITGLTGGALIRAAFGAISSAVRKKAA